MSKHKELWQMRPIHRDLIRYAIADTVLLYKLYLKNINIISDNLDKMIITTKNKYMSEILGKRTKLDMQIMCDTDSIYDLLGEINIELINVTDIFLDVGKKNQV